MTSIRHLLVCACLGACSSLPGLEDPKIIVEPRLTLYKLRGETQMQFPASGSIQNGSSQDVGGNFGFSNRDEDLMVVGAYGDGFSGFEFAFQYIRMGTSKSGVLTSRYGNLLGGGSVVATYEMDEYRLAYTAALIDHETESEVRMRLGVGGALVHRDATWKASEAATGRVQPVDIEHSVIPYVSARAGVEYLGAGLVADVAYNPDAAPGGDYTGDLLDIEIKASYRFDDQGITVVGGYRRSDLKSSGTQSFLEFDNDFVLDGYFLGVGFEF